MSTAGSRVKKRGRFFQDSRTVELRDCGTIETDVMPCLSLVRNMLFSCRLLSLTCTTADVPMHGQIIPTTEDRQE
jgi:hypothetical protein